MKWKIMDNLISKSLTIHSINQNSNFDITIDIQLNWFFFLKMLLCGIYKMSGSDYKKEGLVEADRIYSLF